MKEKTVEQQMNAYIDKCILMGIKLFDFEYYDNFVQHVCLTEIYVPHNDPEPFIQIPSFVSYLHYSVICENKDLASCKIFIPKECSIEWNYGSWERGRKQEFFKSAKEIIIEEGHPEFFSEDGILFNGDKTELLLYPAEKKDEEYTLPESVVLIDIDAFLGNKYLRRLNISKNVREIEQCEFDGRTRIEVDADNKKYKSIDGSLYSKNGKTVYHLFQDEEGNIKIAEGTNTIKEIFFDKKVKELYLPDSVKPRNGASLIKNNLSNCERVVVPESLKKYLKSCEKYIEVIYY